ncbi:PilZ domain-containing protein [Jeongeupia chitinilytica]|uniref:Cyclic di-GMP receptor atypical PilZ domain-containing protein n=1 Tax=Jeongeupia chitinilytica TaxID=1041641 RepID=A0ABQ3GYS4_9NEIS|nr:PilZ domain-containing protein [Jeongeupia chitinilytica]GHD60220.1 hypothetical protein GCM10007350_12870 [Jeongeupia chitinilytica]
MSAFPEGVCFDAILPLVWQPDARWQPFEVARYLDVLADFDVTERAEPISAEQGRLDLQLIWLARLANPILPAPAGVTVGLEFVRWQGGGVSIGERGCLSIAPGEALPHLLALPAEIVAIDAAMATVTARWQLDHPAARDAFERYVFRRHREQIRHDREAKS